MKKTKSSDSGNFRNVFFIILAAMLIFFGSWASSVFAQVSIDSPAEGIYLTGDNIFVIVLFSSSVNITGTPQLILETGANDAVVDSSSYNDRQIHFLFTVAAGHTTDDLDYVDAFSLSVNGGTITDTVTGLDVDLTLPTPGSPGSLSGDSRIITIPPAVLNVTSPNPDGTYFIGDTLTITVQFSDIVYVTGSPVLKMGVPTVQNNDDHIADYFSGSGTDTLSFEYTVVGGHISPDLEYGAADSMGWFEPGTSIRNAGGVDADLILALPGEPNSLAYNKNIVIDGLPFVQFDLASQSIVENELEITATVRLSDLSVSETSVPFTISGTATEYVDWEQYTLSPIFIPGGLAETAFTIRLYHDWLYEADEAIEIALGTPVNAKLGANTVHTITIEDNDAMPSVQFTSTAQSSPESGGVMTVTIELSAISGTETSVPFTIGGTATGGGTDYTINAGPVIIPAGSATGTVTITPNNDTIYETNETVVITLGAPTNATLGTNIVHTATLANDDTLPAAQFMTTAQSGMENGNIMAVAVQLSNASWQDISVPFTIGGTATGGGMDYTATASPVLIAAGSTTGTINITPTDDAVHEINETVVLTMGTPTNAVAGTSPVHTATILNDDPVPSVTLSATGSPLVENGGQAVLTGALSNASHTDVTVNLSFSGTALATVDYTASGDNITIPAGQSNAGITLTGQDDFLDEADETVIVDIQTVANGVESGVQQVTVTITDNDTGGIVINEIYAVPGDDANGDGMVDSVWDEFVEIVNNTAGDEDISGWTLTDSGGTVHAFPAGTILKNQCGIVIFGGGVPQGDFGYVPVQTASTGSLNLDDTGDTVTLLDDTAMTRATYTYGSQVGNIASITRDPDVVGGFVLHANSPFSPGTQTVGDPFTGCGSPPMFMGNPVITEFEDAGDLVIDLWAMFDDATDPDNLLAFDIPAGPDSAIAVAAVDGTAGELTLSFVPDAVGGTDMTVRVTDTDGLFLDTVFSITVSSVNDPPAFDAADPPEADEDAGEQLVTGWVANFMPGGGPDESGQSPDAYIVSDISDPGLFETAPAVDAGGNLTYTPAANAFGSATFNVSVRDDGGTADGGLDTSDPLTFSIVVNEVNDPPTAEDLEITTGEYASGIPYSGTLTGNDIDGDALTYGNGQDPVHGSAIVSPDGTFTYKPEPNYTGEDSFSYIVDDGRGGTASAWVTVGIKPVAFAADISVNEDETLSGKLPGSEDVGDSKVYGKHSNPNNGVLDIKSNGDFYYKPDANYHGADEFWYWVKDSAFQSDPARVAITVNSVNDDPMANDQDIVVYWNKAHSGKLSGTDVENDALSFSISGSPNHGSADISSNGDFIYMPDIGYTGTDVFSFYIVDENGGKNEGRVSIAVQADEDAAWYPSDNAVDVRVDTDIYLMFSLPVRRDTVINHLNIPSTVRHVKYWHSNTNGTGGDMLFIDLQSPLEFQTTYHFALLDGALDLAGNPVKGTDISFTTEKEPIRATGQPVNGSTGVDPSGSIFIHVGRFGPPNIYSGFSHTEVQRLINDTKQRLQEAFYIHPEVNGTFSFNSQYVWGSKGMVMEFKPDPGLSDFTDYVYGLDDGAEVYSVEQGWTRVWMSGTSFRTDSLDDHRPVADFKFTENVFYEGAEIVLANGSYDPDGSSVKCGWELTQKPKGSLAEISPDTVVPAYGSPTKSTFTADLYGTYEVKLTVSDGTLESTKILQAKVFEDPGNIENLEQTAIGMSAGYTEISGLRIYREDIRKIEEDLFPNADYYYELSGNVSVERILHFDGPVYLIQTGPESPYIAGGTGSSVHTAFRCEYSNGELLFNRLKFHEGEFEYDLLYPELNKKS